jgi:adenosine deaminase
LHLEGSIQPETAVELAGRHDTKLTEEEVGARYTYSNFAGFLDAFKWVTSFLRTPDDYALVTKRLAEELVRQNVVYAEVLVSAGVMLRRMQDVEANFAAIREVAESAPFSRLRMAWILDATRQFGPDAAMEVAHWASKLQHSGVIGFGMGGDELSQPTVNFRPSFDYARKEGLHVMCHAGEVGGPESVREAIELLGAERIGHGLALMHDSGLAQSLATRRMVVLDICLTSNVCTGALAKQTGKLDASLANHPLREFVEGGLAVTLSTDDPGMFHTNLLTEYARAASLGLSNAQLLGIAEQSFSAAFLPPADKRGLLDNFRAASKTAGLV